MPPQPVIDQVIDGIVDGLPLDWDALGSQAPDEDRELLECLRILGHIADLHRSTTDEAAPVEQSERDRSAEDHAGIADDGSESWGRYRLTEKVGEGSFGGVYRAWDPDLQREIAIKILHSRVSDAQLKERLLREGRALAKVRHPNVVSVFGVEAHGDRVGLCMEFVHGATLESELVAQGSLTAREATAVGEEVCRALSAVHLAGFVHRDVKARNVMREESGRIVLMDFGTGREAEELRAGTRVGLAGTPLYMAPEVLAGLPASESSDIYSVGVLLYRLVTGAYPVEGRSIDELRAAHMQGRRRPATEHRAGLPRPFIRVLDQALASDPQRRHATADVLGEALAGLSRKARVLKAVRLVLSVTLLPLGILGVLGLLTTYNFNITLGRVAPFNRDPVSLLLKLGWQSMFTTILGAALLAGVLGATGRLFRPLTSRFARVTERWGLNDPGVLAQVVGTIAVVALVTIVWRFSDVILACATNVSLLEDEQLALLHEGQTFHAFLYRMTLNALAVGLVATMVRLGRLRARRRVNRSLWTLAPLGAILAVTVVLSELPYRIIWQNKSERIAFAGERCYVLGESGSELLLYCPDKAPPRNRVVRRDDPAIGRTGIVEGIFSPLAPAGE
ncbi:MAG: serine/threonine-protein kinase [Acidobacteriota bacterium]